MPPRPTRPPKSCPTCPTAQALQQQPVTQAARVLAITSQGEGERLWKHLLFGTQTLVQMAEGYADLGMPGECTQQLTALRDQLNRVLTKLKGKTNGPEAAASPVGSPAPTAPS